jgi:hypothetical protein
MQKMSCWRGLRRRSWFLDFARSPWQHSVAMALGRNVLARVQGRRLVQ